MRRAVPRSASPDSSSPVFWMTTRGSAFPSHSPAARAIASPSRVAVTRRIVGWRRTSGKRGPDVLSGIPTTCVIPRWTSVETVRRVVTRTRRPSLSDGT